MTALQNANCFYECKYRKKHYKVFILKLGLIKICTWFILDFCGHFELLLKYIFLSFNGKNNS